MGEWPVPAATTRPRTQDPELWGSAAATPDRVKEVGGVPVCGECGGPLRQAEHAPCHGVDLDEQLKPRAIDDVAEPAADPAAGKREGMDEGLGAGQEGDEQYAGDEE